MNNFHSFLNEQQGVRVSELKWLELLHEKAKTSHEMIKKNPLYKLMKGRKDDFMLYDPKKMPDKSSYWIDKLTAEFSGWKKFPSRTSCLRAYSSYERSGDQPHSYVVIPLDRAKLGVCKKASFYRSFEEVAKTMFIEKLDNEGLEKWIRDIAQTVATLSEKPIDIGEINSYNGVKVALKKIDKVLLSSKLMISKKLKEDHDIEDDSIRRLQDMLSRHVTTLELYLQEKLDPENNGFTMMNVESLRELHDREIWIESPCLLIRRETYVDLHKRGEIK